MFRGAIILGIGFSLGYVKGMKDSEFLAEKLIELIDELKKPPVDAETTGTDITDDEKLAADINARAS